MASKKKLKARIAVLEERLVSANNYNEAILKEANAHRDVIEDIIKAIVTNFFDDGYFDATVREIRATIEEENARKEKLVSRVMPRHHQHPDWINCDRCRTGIPKDEWDYISDMCEKCSKDRSRWHCIECGENLGLENDIKEGRRWYGLVEYCKRCITPPQTMEENGGWERTAQFMRSAKYREEHLKEYPIMCPNCYCQFNSEEWSWEAGYCKTCTEKLMLAKYPLMARTTK